MVCRETELRQTVTAECTVRVRRPKEYALSFCSMSMFTHANKSVSPTRSTWQGASRFATNKEELNKVAITRQEYQEQGSSWAARKFAGALL